jgi:hypothetical protein
VLSDAHERQRSTNAAAIKASIVKAVLYTARQIRQMLRIFVGMVRCIQRIVLGMHSESGNLLSVLHFRALIPRHAFAIEALRPAQILKLRRPPIWSIYD